MWSAKTGEDDGEEKKDPSKVVTPTGGPSASTSSGGGAAAGATEFANPLYCACVDGKYIYKDPATKNEFMWDEDVKQWKPTNVFGSSVEFNGSSYTYTDSTDGTKYEWDSDKSAWFPKSTEVDSRNGSSGKDLKSTSVSIDSGTSGYHNPNYDNSLQSNQPRRFYYAALSPTEMGVDEPVLFLSPDDQVNNNSTVPTETEWDVNDHDHQRIPENTKSSLLPPGWEKHEDSNGPYYWHIKSGTIQRELPTSEQLLGTSTNPALLIPGTLTSAKNLGAFRKSQTISSQLSTSISFSETAQGGHSNSNLSNFQPSASTNAPSVISAPLRDTHSSIDNKEKRKSWSQFLENSEREREQSRMRENLLLDKSRPKSESSLRFVAVSLGCLSISEEDLTPERSSRAVSKVIAELTSLGHGLGGKTGTATGLEVAGKIWGEGSELYLELDDSHLRVKTKDRSLTVAEQPIHSIRVWGVGRDDPRDFAYVAREKLTRQFLCHVFRLEMNARPLASALRDACKKIMIERQQKQKRPTTLPTGLRKNITSSSTSTAACFPTPMDEPRKILRAYYLGSKMVNKPTGMDTLNSAIDSLRNNEPIQVNVSVAPSVILISSDESETPKVWIEIRVRYLSFMGIGRDVQTCGVIVHTARDDFQSHCFFSTPSSGALCKAIEAACVLRYQKCLDAHHHETSSSQPGNGDNAASGTAPNSGSTPSSKAAANIAAAFKNVLASFGRSRSLEEKIDDEFLARYQLSYGFNTEDSKPSEESKAPPTTAVPPQEQKSASEAQKRKLPPQPPTWFELDEAQNTKVYVSNLPLDITEEEFVDFMQKCGLVMKDPQTNQIKIKLYTDAEGNMKGDGLCTYIKIESVQLALQILDGYDIRGKKIKVERAKFQLKGQYDPTKKPKQKKRKDKEKFKKTQEQLFAWKPEKLRGERAKHERIVVVQNGFSSSDFDEDAGLILEFQEDFREEAGKCGNCKKVVIFDRHPEGILQIFMSTPEEADAVVNLFNNRFFGGRQISAYLWDGHTKYKIAETDAEREDRLQNWEKFIGEDNPNIAEEDKVTPPVSPNASAE